jgi:hypothetical protein
MLTATRGPNDFVGISAMVDPGQRNKVGGVMPCLPVLSWAELGCVSWRCRAGMAG